MSQSADRLSDAQTDITEKLLKYEQRGTTESKRRVRRIDLALEHAKDWAPDPPRGDGFERGGTSATQEEREKAEQSAVRARCLSDAERMKWLSKRLAGYSFELSLLTARYADPVDASQLPKPHEVEECPSCARPQPGTKRGYWAPPADEDPHAEKRWGKAIADSVKARGLCSFCRKHSVANAQARQAKSEKRGQGTAPGVLAGDYPELRAVDLLHRQGEHAAARWLTENMAKAS